MYLEYVSFLLFWYCSSHHPECFSLCHRRQLLPASVALFSLPHCGFLHSCPATAMLLQRVATAKLWIHAVSGLHHQGLSRRCWMKPQALWSNLLATAAWSWRPKALLMSFYLEWTNDLVTPGFVNIDWFLNITPACNFSSEFLTNKLIGLPSIITNWWYNKWRPTSTNKGIVIPIVNS